MLILVRHGRTAANAQGLLQGRLDQPLDELGERQAADVSAYVLRTSGPIDAVISSPLVRAQQTAVNFGLPVEIDERWTELAYGKYEGASHTDVPSEVWNMWRKDPDFVPEGGESLSMLDARVRPACAALIDRARLGNVVVVSHVSPIKTAVAWALDVDLGISWRSHLSTASVCRIDIRANGPVLFSFNESAPSS
jgi:alpha-ribazole phosphatase